MTTQTAGYATPEGTAAYQARYTGKIAEGHFRPFQGLSLSSIGLGTYLGHHDEATDDLYAGAIKRAVSLGCNVLDSAINYRCQRSERSIGRALRELFAEGTLRREEIFIATKGGFIPFDGTPPGNPVDYFMRTFVHPSIAQPDEIVAGCHCMTPKYLAHQIDQSLSNLGLECLDAYYLHNPETQLQEVSREEFLKRIRAAFAFLEEAVDQGKIRVYGTATWDGYRNNPRSRDHLMLEELLQAAQEIAGNRHHFRILQLPYNLGMPEAYNERTQQVDKAWLSTLTAAEEYGLYVMASASILQGQLSRGLPEALTTAFPGLRTDAQRAIQFVRSTPGMGTALVGMKRVEHIEENLATAAVAPIPPSQFLRLFGRE
jgi:aryl-alcohol dehydrogenase-like predicted oxidoreductase